MGDLYYISGRVLEFCPIDQLLENKALSKSEHVFASKLAELQKTPRGEVLRDLPSLAAELGLTQKQVTAAATALLERGYLSVDLTDVKNNKNGVYKWSLAPLWEVFV